MIFGPELALRGSDVVSMREAIEGMHAMRRLVRLTRSPQQRPTPPLTMPSPLPSPPPQQHAITQVLRFFWTGLFFAMLCAAALGYMKFPELDATLIAVVLAIGTVVIIYSIRDGVSSFQPSHLNPRLPFLHPIPNERTHLTF